MLIHFFWFFFHLKKKKKLFIEQCVILIHRTPEIIFTPKRKKWDAPSAPASMTTHSTRQMCWFFNQNRAVQTSSSSTRLLQSGIGPVCLQRAPLPDGGAVQSLYNRSLLLVLQTKKLKWKRVFLKTMKSVHWSYCLCFLHVLGELLLLYALFWTTC